MKNLLENLKRENGCTYLSDLRFCMNKPGLLKTMNSTMEEYSLDEWNDACSYLFCKDDKSFKKLTSYEELKKYLSE